jgi:hypothetical protein
MTGSSTTRARTWARSGWFPGGRGMSAVTGCVASAGSRRRTRLLRFTEKERGIAPSRRRKEPRKAPLARKPEAE